MTLQRSGTVGWCTQSSQTRLRICLAACSRGGLGQCHTVTMPWTPERTLILLRHSKSDWSGGEPDFERPLNARGLREAPIAGRWLADNIGGIDLAVVSPAVRTRSTWKLASAELDSVPSTRFEESAYGASASVLLAIVRALPDEAHTVILVGHNPGIEDLASHIADESVSMSTSVLAVIGMPGSWAAVDGSPGAILAFGRPPAPLGS